MKSVTYTEKCGCGNMYVTIAYNDDGVVHIDSHLGKAGTCPKVLTSVINNLANGYFAMGADMDAVINKINNYHCSRMTRDGVKDTWSCADAIAKGLKKFKKMLQETNPPKQ